MSDWIDDLNEKQEAFTLGGRLGGDIEPAAGGCDPVPRTRTEGPRRRKKTARRKSMRFRNGSLAGAKLPPRGALTGRIVSASTARVAEIEIQKQGALEESSSTPAADTTHNFFSLLKQAIQSNKGTFPEASEESYGGEIQLPEAHAEVQAAEKEENSRTWSVRIVMPRAAALNLRAIVHTLTASWNLMRKQVKFRPAKKRLRVCETISLGEKRCVVLIEVDGEQFLLGGASGSVTPIARLESPQPTAGVASPLWTQDAVQA